MLGAQAAIQSSFKSCRRAGTGASQAMHVQPEPHRRQNTASVVNAKNTPADFLNKKAQADAPFSQHLLCVIPALNNFARRLCGHVDVAEDLVQEALMKAWAAQDSYKSNTNFQAWIFTILRNHYFSWRRKRAWFVPWDGEVGERLLISEPAQTGHVELAELASALSVLPALQQEALILIGVDGCTYEEAAQIVSCAVGTIKSRVTRGRKALRDYLGSEQKLTPQSAPTGTEASAWIVGKLQMLTPNATPHSMPSFP